MPTNPQIVRHNVETGKIVTRAMTANELAQHEADIEIAKAFAAAEAERTLQRESLLKRLGITEDEAKLLLS